MRLDHSDSLRRLVGADHAILGTVHPERGPDLVPVAFAVASDVVGIPVDLVKPKRSTVLQREANLLGDARATLLVEHWSADDWGSLWWVRAQLEHVRDPDLATVELLEQVLVSRYPQYRDRPFAKVLVLRIVSLSGWSAGA